MGNSFTRLEKERRGASQKLGGEKKIKSHSSHGGTVFSKKPPRLLLSRRFRRATATDDGADQRAPRERIHRVFGKKANSIIMRGFDSDVFGLGEERGVREEPGIHVRELLLRCDSFFWSSSSLFGSSVRFFIRLVRALGEECFSLSLFLSLLLWTRAS